MSCKRVIKTLIGLGLSEAEADVYIYLASDGPQKAKNIGDALRLQEMLLHQSLENLQDKGLVSAIKENIALFYALPFNKALDLLVNTHLEEAKAIEKNRKGILARWKKMVNSCSKD
jgi:sugar-specific transcriptional regulator TrmB